MVKNIAVYEEGRHLSLHYQFLHLCDRRRYSAGNYMYKVNNRNTRTRCEIYSKLAIKTLERRHCRSFDVFTVNYEQLNAGFISRFRIRWFLKCYINRQVFEIEISVK